MVRPLESVRCHYIKHFSSDLRVSTRVHCLLGWRGAYFSSPHGAAFQGNQGDLAERQFIQTRLKIAAASDPEERQRLQNDLETIREPGDLESSVISERTQYLLSLGPEKVRKRTHHAIS